jgi:hypothetical protein
MLAPGDRLRLVVDDDQKADVTTGIAGACDEIADQALAERLSFGAPLRLDRPVSPTVIKCNEIDAFITLGGRLIFSQTSAGTSLNNHTWRSRV